MSFADYLKQPLNHTRGEVLLFMGLFVAVGAYMIFRKR